ncbi:MAG: thiolase domain-containing protein [Chloroflexota bacterium]
MREVYIVGIGQVPVREHWDTSLRHLGAQAVLAAMADAEVEHLDALYVGNMLSGALNQQEHLGALLADFVGYRGIEAMKIEAACASGAAALRVGYSMVASGLSDIVAVLGIEKMTEPKGRETTAALAMAADGDYEADQGVSFVALNALLMRRYMHQYQVSHEEFAEFAVVAHENGANNPNAMFRRPITANDFVRSPQVCSPIRLLDASPIADGAAAVILTHKDVAKSLTRPPVCIAASALAIDSLAIHDRRDPLFLAAGAKSAHDAYQQAGITPSEVDFFELHDAFSIMAALSLEAAGFAERGGGAHLANEGAIRIDGRIPICTMGGLKARGHPVGATGIYQVVEIAQQMRGEAGGNQLTSPRWGMAQNIGGSGASIVTHILRAP